MIRSIAIFLMCIFNPALLLSQSEGTMFKEALISKNAEIHYYFSESPGYTEKTNGRMVGICIDVMADFEFFLLDKYGITVKVIEHEEDYLNLPDFFENIKDSKYGVFGLSNITRNKTREENYHFSPPFIRNYAVLISNSQIPDLKSLDEIKNSFTNLKALTVPNTTNHQQLLDIKKAYYPEMEIEYLNSFDSIMKTIDQSTSYFSIVDMNYFINSQKQNFLIKEHKVGFQSTDELAIILPLESDWDIPLRKFLTEEYKNSMSYRKIITKHLGWETLVWLDEMDALYNALGK